MTAKIICRTVCYGDKEMTPQDVFEHIIDNAGNLASGEIETMRAEIRMLSELLASVAARLPVQDLIDIANHHHYETFRLEQTE